MKQQPLEALLGATEASVYVADYGEEGVDGLSQGHNGRWMSRFSMRSGRFSRQVIGGRLL